MSERLTFKEAGSIIKMAFKITSKKNKHVFVWSSLVGVAFGGIIGAGLLMGEATRTDLQGEKAVHSACTVTNKDVNYAYNGVMYYVSGYSLETSCGGFDATSATYENLELNQSYDLTATAGNWANKPTVVSAVKK